MSLSAEDAFEYVKNAYENKRLSHAFGVFSEKVNFAEAFASKIIGLVSPEEEDSSMSLFGDAMLEPDVVEDKPLQDWQSETVRILSPESKSRRIKVEQLRELEKSFQVSVAEGNWKVGVIRDAERMNLEAQNAFLKTLEEPPQRTLLILISSKPQALLPTVHSRMTKIQLNTPADQRGQLTESEAKLEKHLEAFLNSHHTMADALSLRGGFSQILVEQKATITKSYEAVLKEEVEQYKKTTEGDWLKRQEAHYLALAEANYLTERASLIQFLAQWLMNVLKQKTRATSSENTDSRLSDYLEPRSASDLIKQLEALYELELAMDTNAQEMISLDVAFIKAFVGR